MSASIRVCAVHFDHVLINMITMDVLQMALLQVISVACVFHSKMSATRPVLMLPLGFIHRNPFL
jgi:hypothetical protein